MKKHNMEMLVQGQVLAIIPSVFSFYTKASFVFSVIALVLVSLWLASREVAVMYQSLRARFTIGQSITLLTLIALGALVLPYVSTSHYSGVIRLFEVSPYTDTLIYLVLPIQFILYGIAKIRTNRSVI